MLDTNICIYLLKQRPPQVAMRFAECYEGEVVISTVTLAELRYGVRCCPPETRAQNEAALNALLEVIPAIPFDEQSANQYAEVRYATREKKSDTLDKLIAAQAVALEVVLVTNNEADFQRYPGVKIENWSINGVGCGERVGNAALLPTLLCFAICKYPFANQF